jgi:hypothetical protein
MTIQDVITRLKSDIDDEQDINQYFSDSQLINFSIRAIQYVNDRLRFCRKYNFLRLQPYFDSYPLPVDYIGPIHMIDFRNQAVLPYAKYNPERLKSQLAINNLTTLAPCVNIWQADESRRRVYFDRVPDTTVGYAWNVHVDAYSYATRPYVSVKSTGGYWYDPVYVELQNSGGEKSVCKVSVIEATYAGVGTLTWSGKTFTLSSEDANLKAGDTLEVCYKYGTTTCMEEIEVDTVTDSTHFEAVDTPSHNCSVATNYHWTSRSVSTGLTALKKLYFSEENITNEHPRFVTPTECYLVDCGLLYYYQPYYSYTGDGTITFSSTTGTISGNSKNIQLSVGDYLLINNEVRAVTDLLLTGTKNRVTIDEAFSSSITNGTWRFIKLSEEIPFPPDILKAITSVAMHYVYLRQSLHDRANSYLGLANDFVESIRLANEAEDLGNLERQRDSYDKNVRISVPYRM